MGIKAAHLSLVAAAVAVALGAAAPALAGPSVATLVVQSAGGGRAAEFDGRIEPLRQATVAAQVPGSVLALTVKAGDTVKAGQTLARIDDRDVQAGLLRGEAGVAQAEAEARNAKLQLDRTRELQRQGFVSPAALDVAESQWRAAQAGLQQAQAGRTQAALARGFATATAPFDAVVLATHVEAGDLAAAGRPIATVYAPGALRAVVQVPASRADAARSATKVEVGLADGRWIVPAKVTVLPTADPVSQTVEWRLELPADAGALLPGQSVRVRFAGAPGPQRIVLPPAALLRRGELTAVYALRDGGFELRAVRTGADLGAAGVEVVAGLRAGERIAADALKAGLAGAQAQ